MFMSFDSPSLPSSIIPPVIHPTSSGLQCWGQVLGCHLFCGVHSCILPSPPCHVMWLLAPTIHPVSSGLQGWGQVLGHLSFCGVHCMVFVPASSPLLPSPHHCVTWPLAPTIHPVSSGSQGWGGCWVICHCPSFMLPISTLQAAAHSSSWGCCGGEG